MSRSTPSPVQPPGRTKGQAPRQPFVLVVDDEPGILASLGEALHEDGYEVRVAADAPAAFAIIRQAMPDLVLLDLMLPGMSGEEFLQIYRDLPGRHAPVIVLTAAGHGAEQRAAALGADAVLAKPYAVQALLDLIAHHVLAFGPATASGSASQKTHGGARAGTKRRTPTDRPSDRRAA